MLLLQEKNGHLMSAAAAYKDLKPLSRKKRERWKENEM